MTTPHLTTRKRAGLPWLAFVCGAAALTPVLAQNAPSKTTPAMLAKYDTNKNGVLDSDEIAAMNADQKKNSNVPVESSSSNSENVVQLSPFEVNAADDKGYYAPNTMSGTRIASKLEDLGSSISVVTKQQMQDFALLDINDIFAYEANTEGTLNYTDVVIDRNGVATDNVARDPNNANRIRGIGAANQAIGNFELSGRAPIDPGLVDAVEISRGPNSSIFGLGNGSGTVNAIAATANTSRPTTLVELRADDLGSFRSLLDINRPILKNKLAVRGIVIYQADEFVRKPSYSRTNRYDGLLTYKPFKSTTLRLAYEHFENYARRPNAILPRDAITYWQQQGMPTWDPSTWTVTKNGVKTVVPFNSNQATETTLLGTGLESGGTGLAARPSIFVDRYGNVDLWMVGRQSGISTTTGLPTPDAQAGNPRFVESQPAPRVGPLAPTTTSLTDKSLYDWSEVNIAAANWNQDKVDTYTAELEQFIINTPRHLLAAQLGFRREDSYRYTRTFIGTSGESPMVVYVDVNEKLLDGKPNPFFLRPYVNALEPTVTRNPEVRDTSRAQLVYKLTLSQNKGWTRWIGDHTFSAYGEYKDRTWAGYRFRDAIVDTHAWLPGTTTRATGITAGRGYYRYYLGDNQGQNIEYGSPAWDKLSGTRNLQWFNAATNQWVSEPAVLGEAYSPGVQRQENIIRTWGGVVQSHFLDDRLVATFGRRQDSNYNRNFAQTNILPDGINPDYASDDTSPNNWFFRSGKTKSGGAVAKPFRGWAALDRRTADSSGLARHTLDFIQSLTFFYNKADSFLPATIAQNLNLKLLPNPSSNGKDYGFSFNLGQKLFVRVGMYNTKQINSRTGDAGTIATRAGRIDFAFAGNNDQFNLQRQALAWITAGNPTLTADQQAVEVAKVMGVPVDRLAQMNAFPIAETSDVISKGKEIEINFTPNRYWTSKMTIAQQNVVEQNVTPGVQEYIDSRMPIWTTVIDTRTGLPWFTTRYGSAGTASDFLLGSVQAPYKLLRATEGKSRPQIRQWRANGFASFKLAGLPFLRENKILSRMSVSGAMRWEDTGAIGYYTFPNDPNAYDPDHQIRDHAHMYFDFGANYQTRIYRNRIGMRVQLNVRNAFENGGLQPVGALPNGQPHTFRIVDPRQIILTTSFDL